MGIVPGVDWASGVDRRNRGQWLSQLYGIDRHGGVLLGGERNSWWKFLESGFQITEVADCTETGRVVVYSSRLQDLRT